MNLKKIFILTLSSILILFFLNMILLNNYDNYLYNNYSQVINALLEKYPEAEKDIIDIITSSKSNTNHLEKYGIDNETIKDLTSYKSIRNKTILITSSFYLIIILSIVIIY